MKFFHISDMHLGKRLFEYSLTDDQAYILDQITELCRQHRPDALLIAGDIYDKQIPPAEAVTVFDGFLCKLSSMGIPTLIISGNHDSPERLAFGSDLMAPSGITICRVWNGTAEKVTLRDGFGEVDVYLLPFIKPIHARRFFPDTEIQTYTDAVAAAIADMDIDSERRNILVTHQFVTGASRSDSEEISVGGSDNVDASVFDCFDYVALGHIHGPQNVGCEKIRYSGTPLKYSFSEVGHEKSVTVVELGQKGDLNVSTLALTPLCDLREIRGSYEELTNRDNYINTRTDDYLHITLTDEDDIPDAAAKLRVIYPRLMKLDYDNARTRAAASPKLDVQSENLSPFELFCRFFQKQNCRPLDEKQSEYMSGLIEKIFEGRNG